MEPSHPTIGRVLVGSTVDSSAPARGPAEVTSKEAAASFKTSRESSGTDADLQRPPSESTRDQPRDTTSPIRGTSILNPQGRVRQTISWNVPDSNVIHQPRPRRILPPLSLLDRQARRISNGQSTPEPPDGQPRTSHPRGRERTDTMYQQSNKSHTSLMREWTRKLDRDARNDHRRSRSVLGLSSFRSTSRNRRVPAKRPASAGYDTAESRQPTPRVVPLRRFSWQKTQVTEPDAEDGEWRHREGPLVLIPGDLPSVIEDQGAYEPDSDDESIATVIHRPASSQYLPSGQIGYTGSLPRYYPIALKMATLPPPSPALGVLFPGEPVEQIQAQLAQVHLELVKKEEELSKTKKQLVEGQKIAALANMEVKKAAKEAKKREERLSKLQEENAALRHRSRVNRVRLEVAEEEEEKKWWNR